MTAEPAIPLPEQAPPPPTTPESTLATAVIQHALRDARQGLGRNLRSAIHFFTAGPHESPFELFAACVGIDPESTREAVQRDLRRRFETREALQGALDTYQRDDRTDPRAAASF